MHTQDLRPPAEYALPVGTAAEYDLRPRAKALGGCSMTNPPRVSAVPLSPSPLRPEATVDLIERVKHGDEEALNRLLERCIPALQRWAHGRLPASARGMHDTVDLVQDTVIAAMKRFDGFDARHQGALLAYLRKSVMNRILDIVRHDARRPRQVEIPEQLPDDKRSPLEEAIGAQNAERYEQALQRLSAGDREAIINRLELLYSYEELAVVLDKPSAAAARMAVTRAMKRLAREMLHA
jgi:RNA polymerase sigma factor (sigma-70 family)